MLNNQKILNSRQSSIDRKVSSYMKKRKEFNGGDIVKRKIAKYNPRVLNGGSINSGSVLKTEHAFKNSKGLNKVSNTLKFKNKNYKLYHKVFSKKSSPISIKEGKIDIKKWNLISGRNKIQGLYPYKEMDDCSILHSNTGLESFDTIENGLSMIGTSYMKHISELVFNWSSKFRQEYSALSRIRDQYELALSTEIPSGCKAKYKEAKTLFNIINKVYDKVDIPSYNVSIKSRQIDIDIVFDEIIKEIISDKDVMSSFIKEFNNSLSISDAMDEVRASYGSREFLSYIVKQGITDIMSEAGVRSAYKDTDSGIYMDALKYGTAFSYLDYGHNGIIPFKLRNIPLTNVMFDDSVTSIRGALSNKNARRAMVVLDYSRLSDAIADFPDYKEILEDHCGWGMLPFSVLDNDYSNWYSKDERAGQIGIYFDIDKREYVVMAGSDATVLEFKDKYRFPFLRNGEAYFPIFMTHIFGNEKWIYKRGLGHFSSQLNNIESITDNAQVKAFLQDNLPIDVMSVREGSMNKVSNRLKKANQEAQTGVGRATVMSERSQTGEEDIYGVKPLSGSYQWGADKKQFIEASNDKDIVGAGINMSDVNNNPYKTTVSIQSEQVASLAIADRIETVNLNEWKELIATVLSNVRKIKNSTPINTESFNSSNPLLKVLMQPDMRILKMILKKLEVSVSTEFSDMMRSRDVPKAKNLERLIAMYPPGSKAYSKATIELSRVNGINLAESDLSPPPPPQEEVLQEAQQQPI